MWPTEGIAACRYSMATENFCDRSLLTFQYQPTRSRGSEPRRLLLPPRRLRKPERMNGVAQAGHLVLQRVAIVVADLSDRAPQDPEACARGAAMMAAVRAGHFADLEEAAEAMAKAASVIEPDPARVKVYEPHYQRYRATYPALRTLMHSMG